MDAKAKQLRQYLNELVEDELRESKSKRIPVWHTKEDVSNFIQARFPEIYKFFTDGILTHPNIEKSRIKHDNSDRIRDKLSGAIFEEVAYIFSGHYFNSGVVLSPKRTKQYFGLLYESVDTVTNTFGFDSLDGVQVPDGLVVRLEGATKRITGFCEFTTIEHQDSIEKKVRGFRAIQSEQPEIFGKSTLYFATPHGGLHYFPGDIRFRVIALPFTRVQFAILVDGLYQMFPYDGETASIRDFGNRVRKQMERARAYAMGHQMPPHYREYLAKIK